MPNGEGEVPEDRNQEKEKDEGGAPDDLEKRLVPGHLPEFAKCAPFLGLLMADREKREQMLMLMGLNTNVKQAREVLEARDKQFFHDAEARRGSIIERAIRKEINKPQGPITDSDLLYVQTLDLSGQPIVKLSPLSGLTKLRHLYLMRCRWLKDLSGLEDLTDLRHLYLTGCTGVQDLRPLAELKRIGFLDLDGCTSVTDLTPLAGLQNLVVLPLRGCTGVTDLSPLIHLESLKRLDLTGCTGLRETDIPEELKQRTNLTILQPDYEDAANR